MNNQTKNINKTAAEHEDDVQEPEVNEEDQIETEESREPEKSEEPKQSKPRPGEVLKKAREKRGISLEIVHEATKIPMDALRAIEEGYQVRMLSPFYVSGFVKMYAKYLDIDISELIEDHKPEELPEHIESDIEEDFEVPKWITNIFTRERMRQIVIGAGVLLGLYLLVQLFGFIFSGASKPKGSEETMRIEVVQNDLQEASPVISNDTRQDAPKIEVPKEPIKVVAPAVKPKPVPKPKPAAGEQPAPTPQTTSPVAIDRDVNLTVRANQNSWLRVKTDGNVVFQSTLRVGAVETWYADKEIEITGRNISQLEFELNGKMIGKLGRKNRNAKKVIITKNGLSVKQ